MKRIMPLLIISVLLSLHLQFKSIPSIHAQSSDDWWDASWPYRIAVTPGAGDVLQVDLDFTQLFDELGLNGALLDVRSLRVIAYQDGAPVGNMPYQETYSAQLLDAQTLITDKNLGEPYWFDEEDTTLSLNSATPEDPPTLHASIEIDTFSSTKTGFRYVFNLDPGVDWTDYESLVYEVYPRVNSSAVDQTPDLYQFELGGVLACSFTEIGGPALAMDQWNAVSVSLMPYGNCTSPNLAQLDYLRFFVNVVHESTGSDNHGYYEPGDQVDLWLNNFRLVDQENGSIRWNAIEGADSYAIYFDTLNHEEHPLPDLSEIAGDAFSVSAIGSPESGGYFHRISGATSGDLTIWTAPITEKISQTQQSPVMAAPLQVRAARGELEAMQLVVNSDQSQTVQIVVSDLVHNDGNAVISADNVELFRVDYVEIEKISDFYGRLGPMPDPLYPLSPAYQITLEENINQLLWFRFRVPKTAKPGIYESKITIGSAEIPISLEVWNFVLPDTAFLNSKFGFDWNRVMEEYGGTVMGEPQPCYEDLKSALLSTFSDYHLTPSGQGDDAPPDGVGLFSLTAYEVTKAQNEWLDQGIPIWWQFNEKTPEGEIVDHPPLPNPTVIDRQGIESRILPWLAWVDRVEGIFYSQTADWDENPWDTPFTNGLSNGNGYFFYPPKDASLAFDPCDPLSNRLVPSIRLELLREGMEDYAYLRLLNGGKPRIGIANPVDGLLAGFLPSRTAFSRIPTTADALRINIAEILTSRQTEVYLPLLLR